MKSFSNFSSLFFLYFLVIVSGRPRLDSFDKQTKCISANESTFQRLIPDTDYDENPGILFEDCGPSSYCYVVWKNDSKRIQILKQGCFADERCKNNKFCKAEDNKANFFFCCCNGDFCNKDFIYEPHPAPSSTVIDENLEENWISASLTWALRIFLLCCGLCVIFLILRHRRQCFNSVRKPTQLAERTHEEPRSSTTETYGIELLEEKANGRFGAVWRGVMKDEIVAVKIFPVWEKRSWETELKVFKLSLMEHPNILRFINAEKHDGVQKEYWLITAYHELGSLNDYLRYHTVTVDQLCIISFTMARGLAHLHEEIPGDKLNLYKPAIAHRDFKSSNVLLNNDLSVCIADFGLAMVFRSQNCGTVHTQVGTQRYMAPEVLDGIINFSRSAFLCIDMYACSLVLWEILSRCETNEWVPAKYQLPFEAELGEHPNMETLREQIVSKMYRPKLKESWRNHPSLSYICTIIEECWDADPVARLTAACVMERFHWHMQPETKRLYNIY